MAQQYDRDMILELARCFARAAVQDLMRLADAVSQAEPVTIDASTKPSGGAGRKLNRKKKSQ